MVKSRGEDAELPQLSQMQARPDLAVVVRTSAEQFGDDPSSWAEGRRRDGLGRAVAAYLARRLRAAPSREIAARLGYRNVSSVAAACRRVQAAAGNRRFAKTLAELVEALCP